MLDETLPEPAAPNLESLVAACLEAGDPDSELQRRTQDHPELLPLAQRIMARVRAREQVTVSPAVPKPIGPFHIVRTLGAGGMGTVYLAEQTEPLQRSVAIKLVKLGMDTEEVLRRFEFERRALALMSHDNIARVFDAGRTTEGQPYFVMEYVLAPTALSRSRSQSKSSPTVPSPLRAKCWSTTSSAAPGK